MNADLLPTERHRCFLNFINNNNNNNNMETCKAQESVKQPLTALQTGEQRNMKSQCNAKNKDKTITIPYYTKIHYKSLTKALVKR